MPRRPPDRHDMRSPWPALDAAFESWELARIAEALDGPPGLAAFDADGTLWHGDVGEALLLELIAEGRLLDPPPGDLFAEYARRVEVDARDGFAFAVRLMAGLAVDEISQRAERIFATRFQSQLFAPVVALARELTAKGWELWIVSASNRWSVEPGARRLGIPAGRIAAVELGVVGGRLNAEIATPLPTLEGKPELLRLRAGRGPELAFGNSLLDVPLLEAARLAVAVGPRGGETALLREAGRRGWPRLRVELP